MKAKHIPLLIAIAAVASAAWYFVTRQKKGERTNTKTSNDNKTAQTADNSTASTATGNAATTTQPTTTSAWRKATPILQQNWQKQHIDTAKTSVEYREQDGILYVRGTIALKGHQVAGPNGINTPNTPLTYGFNTSEPQKYAPYFRAEEMDGNMMCGTMEFPTAMTFEASNAVRNTPLTYANLEVANAGEIAYFGQTVPTGQFALDFVHHSDDDGCATFTFSKN